MKRHFLITTFLLLFIAMSASAQDYIILKDGSQIQSKVIEVGLTEIKYKLFTNLDGPNISISAAQVMMIRYANGTNQVIKAQTAAGQSSFSGTPSYKYQGVSRRDPSTAFLLSLFLPGAGQFYNREYGKGIAMSGLYGVGLGLLASGFALNSDEYYGFYGSSGYYSEDAETYIGVGAFLMVSTAIWSWIDAPKSARRINRENGLSFNFDIKTQRVNNMMAGRYQNAVGPSISIKF